MSTARTTDTINARNLRLTGTKGGNMVDFNKSVLSNLKHPPILPFDAATKQYVDEHSAGFRVKEPVSLASTSADGQYNNATYVQSDPITDVNGGITYNITLTGIGTLILDGVLVLLEDRVLLKDFTDTNKNGIYKLTSYTTSPSIEWTFTREKNCILADDINGAYCYATAGVSNMNAAFLAVVTNVVNSPYTVANVWNSFRIGNPITLPDAGSGLKSTGNPIEKYEVDEKSNFNWSQGKHRFAGMSGFSVDVTATAENALTHDIILKTSTAEGSGIFPGNFKTDAPMNVTVADTKTWIQHATPKSNFEGEVCWQTSGYISTIDPSDTSLSSENYTYQGTSYLNINGPKLIAAILQDNEIDNNAVMTVQLQVRSVFYSNHLVNSKRRFFTSNIDTVIVMKGDGDIIDCTCPGEATTFTGDYLTSILKMDADNTPTYLHSTLSKDGNGKDLHVHLAYGSIVDKDSNNGVSLTEYFDKPWNVNSTVCALSVSVTQA